MKECSHCGSPGAETTTLEVAKPGDSVKVPEPALCQACLHALLEEKEWISLA